MERCAGVEDICAQSTPGSADEVQARLSFTVAKARSARRAAKRAGPPRKHKSQAEFQTTTLAHMEGFAGKLTALEVSGGCAQSSAVQFGSFFAGHVSCLVKVGMPCTARSSHSAWSWCRRQSQPTSRQVILRCSIRKRGAFLFPASGPRRGCRGARSLQEKCGCRGGVDRGREHRDPQRQRIRRPRAPASFGPRASATYSAHVSRVLESLLWRTRRVCRRTR